ncbi:cytochrome b561 [Humitalea rosea]|uniref:Cytochrome b561 n=1 Tax=Humitalea rosea TaxID=990373 RepID=A0A2W7IMN3_9PROT|nr:cytochrome b [Humitalea rosea]PZW48445.1 cytochrome b561 [Humitalea rosea]
MQPVAEYSSVAKWFHWITAGLLGIALIFGFLLGAVGDQLKDEAEATKYGIYTIHESAGLTLFVVAVARLLWRWRHPAPPLPETIPAALRLASAVVHYALYAGLILQPILGFVATNAWGFPMAGATAYLGFIDLPKFMAANVPLAEVLGKAHALLGWALAVLVVLHVGAVIFHQAIRRDGMLLRMV